MVYLHTFCFQSHLTKHLNRPHLQNPSTLEKTKKKPMTRDFACDQCDKKFFQACTLNKHKYSHSKTRPYVCTLCPTGYYMNMYLKNHYLRVHGLVYTTKEVRKLCGRKMKGDDSD